MSFYNETRGKAIYPTPTIVMVGLLDDHSRYAVSHFSEPGRAVILLGETREELGGSEWLALRAGLEAGQPPVVDLEHEKRLHALLAHGVRSGLIETAHDVSDGGLAVALAEACFERSKAPGIGARIELQNPGSNGGIRPDALLFGESTGRVLVATARPDALFEAAGREGVPAVRIGETGGDRLVIAAAGEAAWIDLSIAELHETWARGLTRRLEAM